MQLSLLLMLLGVLSVSCDAAEYTAGRSYNVRRQPVETVKGVQHLQGVLRRAEIPQKLKFLESDAFGTFDTFDVAEACRVCERVPGLWYYIVFSLAVYDKQANQRLVERLKELHKTVEEPQCRDQECDLMELCKRVEKWKDIPGEMLARARTVCDAVKKRDGDIDSGRIERYTREPDRTPNYTPVSELQFQLQQEQECVRQAFALGNKDGGTHYNKYQEAAAVVQAMMAWNLPIYHIERIMTHYHTPPDFWDYHQSQNSVEKLQSIVRERHGYRKAVHRGEEPLGEYYVRGIKALPEMAKLLTIICGQRYLSDDLTDPYIKIVAGAEAKQQAQQGFLGTVLDYTKRSDFLLGFMQFVSKVHEFHNLPLTGVWTKFLQGEYDLSLIHISEPTRPY